MDISEMATVMTVQRKAASFIMELNHDELARLIVTKDNAVMSGVYSAMVAMIDASPLSRMSLLIALYELLATKKPDVYDAVASFFLEYSILLDRGVCKVNGETVWGKDHE